MTKKARLKKLLMNIFLLGMAGLLYGIFVSYTGLAIPCLFRKVTGLLCPGCGVTGMCVALLHLDWRGAFSCHPGAVCAAASAYGSIHLQCGGVCAEWQILVRPLAESHSLRQRRRACNLRCGAQSGAFFVKNRRKIDSE